MKRFLSLVLCVAMIATAILSISAVTAAEVANGECGSNLTWTLDDAGTLTISGEGYMYSYTDTEPAPWASYAADIKKVVIGDDILSIGAYAFANCTALESVVFTAAYHPYVPATELVEGTVYKFMATNLYGTIYANTISGSMKAIPNAADSRDFYVESATTLDGAPAYRIYYYYNDAKSYFYLSSNKTTTLKYTETIPLYEEITDETTGEVTQGAEISTVWTVDAATGAWLSPAWNNRFLGSDTTNAREDIRCYAYGNINGTTYSIAQLAVKDTTKTEVDGLVAIYDNAFAGCTALANLYCKSSEEAWASSYITAGNNVLANAAVTYNYVEDDNEGGDDVVTAPEAIELIENSAYSVDETVGAVIVKAGSNAGESLEAFMANIATDAGFIQVVDAANEVVTSTSRLSSKYSVQLLDAEGNVAKTYQLVLVGDLDGNGRFTGADVNSLNLALESAPDKGTVEFFAANCDGNTRLGGADVNALETFLAFGSWK